MLVTEITAQSIDEALRKQLASLEVSVDSREVGTVIQVGDGIADPLERPLRLIAKQASDPHTQARLSLHHVTDRGEHLQLELGPRGRWRSSDGHVEQMGGCVY